MNRIKLVYIRYREKIDERCVGKQSLFTIRNILCRQSTKIIVLNLAVYISDTRL